MIVYAFAVVTDSFSRASSVVAGPYGVAPCGRRVAHSMEELRGELVFVQESAEPVASANARLVGRGGDRDRVWEWRLLVECAVWPVCVVVGDVFAQDALEVRLRDDQDPRLFALVP